MEKFLKDAAFQRNPLRVLVDYIRKEDQKEQAKDYDNWRFVGYVLDIGFDTATIITSDPIKKAVGGVPRNSLLLMVPSNFWDFPPSFTLLRVLETAPTPLSSEVQQTYFELQKKSMPELDVFTQSELQWGALKTAVLGMYYPHPDDSDALEFSGDLNNFVSAHKYRVYSPDNALLDLIINSMVSGDSQFPIGNIRLTECRLPLPNKPQPSVPVNVSTPDFLGTRTAMFGKTRLGKSNVIKLIAQSIIETTAKKKNVGQLIFDMNGEYANDNPQDDSKSLASVYPKACEVYSVRPKNPSIKPLKMNFYQYPERSHRILGDLLRLAGGDALYVRNFIGAEVPSIGSLNEMDYGDKTRAHRRILIYWAILKKAGYEIDESKLRVLLTPLRGAASIFDPGLRQNLRDAMYNPNPPPVITSLDGAVAEFNRVAELMRTTQLTDPIFQSSGSSGRQIFEATEEALLKFLNPSSGAGVRYIYPFRDYHDKNAGNIFKGIITSLENGITVILDLGNADPNIVSYYSDELSNEVFKFQMEKFTTNTLGKKYIQLYFEEAHNLFPSDGKVTDIYSRLAKEGAKFNIGMVYSTQSPSTLNRDLLAQTENFFVAHMSSRPEVKALATLNVAYEGLEEDILQAKTPGYVRMLTRSHRFVVPVQARKFSPLTTQVTGG